MTTLVSKTGIEIEIPDVSRVDARAPYRWLSEGWKDLKKSWGFSLGLGLLFAAVGYLATFAAWQAPWAVLTAVSGFVLVAPFLAMGFYAASRAHEQGRMPSLKEEFGCWRGNGRAILMYMLVLALVIIAWSRFNSLITALLTFSVGSPFSADFIDIVSSAEGWAFIGIYAVVGFAVAAAVFAGSVVSLQLMIDRRSDPITALVTSVQSVLLNRRVMLLWAVLIAALTLLGMATAYVGLIVIFPLLGHASWHAYRDLVRA